MRYILFIFLFSFSGTPTMQMLTCLILSWKFLKLCFCCSLTQSCPTLRAPMDCSMLDLPVPHHLLEFAQVHVHCIRMPSNPPSHPLSLNCTHFNSFILYAVLISLFPWFCLPHYLCVQLHHLHFFITVVFLSLYFIFPSLRCYLSISLGFFSGFSLILSFYTYIFTSHFVQLCLCEIRWNIYLSKSWSDALVWNIPV